MADNVNKYPTVGGTGYSYDGNKNLNSDGIWTYVFDTENHLLSANKTGVSASFVYDPMFRQSQKTVGAVKSRYIYSEWQRIADYDGVADTLQNRYVYGTGMDEPLIQVSSAGVLTFLHADKMGSVVATSDNTGIVTNKNVYGPFGETNSLAGTTFGFTGQRYDSELGLYYYKMRHYSPKLGRFLQADPIGFTGEDFNLYSYVKNSPLLFTDPMGESCSCESTSSGAIDAIIKMLQLGISTGVSTSGVSPNDLYDKCVRDCRRQNAGDPQGIANCIWLICSQYQQKGNGQKPKNSAGAYAPEPLIFLKSGVGAPLGGWGILDYYDEETRNAILAFQGLTSVYTATGVFLGYL